MKLFVYKIFGNYVTWPNPSGRSFTLDDRYQLVMQSQYKLPFLCMRKGDLLHLMISNTGKVESYINLGIDTRMQCAKCAFYDKHRDRCINWMCVCNGAYATIDRILEGL